MDDLTHTITVTVSGHYPHGHKTHSVVTMAGTGDLDHMLAAVKASLVASGFSAGIAERLEVRPT